MRPRRSWQIRISGSRAFRRNHETAFSKRELSIWEDASSQGKLFRDARSNWIEIVLEKVMSLPNIRKLMRHPILLLYAYRQEPELARMHTEIELKKAEPIYDLLRRTDWDPAIAIRMFQGKIKCYSNAYLYAFCRHFEPETVVETGVHYGTSSAFILKALRNNGKGHLYSIDLPDVAYTRDDSVIHHDALPYKESAGYAVPPNLRKNWTLIIGDSRVELPRLVGDIGVGKIDIFHHDSKHTYEHMLFEYQVAWPALKNGTGLLVSDDVLWNNAFPDFCAQKGVETNIIGGKGFTFKR